MEIIDILHLNSSAISKLANKVPSDAENLLRSAVCLLRQRLQQDVDEEQHSNSDAKSISKNFFDNCMKITTCDVLFEEVDISMMRPFEKAFVVIPRRQGLVNIEEANTSGFLGQQLIPILFYNLALSCQWKAYHDASNRDKNLRRALRFYQLALTRISVTHVKMDRVFMATLSNVLSIQCYFSDFRGVGESLEALVGLLQNIDNRDETTIQFFATVNFYAKQKGAVAAAA